MAGGDEWIYVLSRQEAAVEAAVAAEDAIATPTAEVENPSKNASDGGAEDEESTKDAVAAQADEDGEDDQEARSDGGSYGSTEMNDYLDYIQDVEEEDDDAATGGDAAVAAAEALRALTIDEAAAPDAAVGRGATGGVDRGKAVVVENPYYDCYGGGHTDAEAYYGGQDYGYDYEHGSGSGSDSGSGFSWSGYVTDTRSGSGSGSGSTSRGYYEPSSGSGSAASRGRSGYDDRYGYGYGYGYNGYGYGGDAYGYGYGGYPYGYGYGGYAYEPRSVLYRAPPAYGAMPMPYYPYPYVYPVQGARYAPPQSRRHPPRNGEPPAVGPPQPDPSSSI